jgi:hypothetical protein
MGDDWLPMGEQAGSALHGKPDVSETASKKEVLVTVINC